MRKRCLDTHANLSETRDDEERWINEGMSRQCLEDEDLYWHILKLTVLNVLIHWWIRTWDDMLGGEMTEWLLHGAGNTSTHKQS